ncbi:hypothetical protein GIB67_034925 [Kingdonia uniflora]|uniref:Uncharacterized protein n=1 Tax=Kingdonia uniflora TaxID=39325 RepID=A0A7J7NH87_9MAGN|nr:hypothetical protein GIB67_034925 [Kingdonia uniflora]
MSPSSLHGVSSPHQLHFLSITTIILIANTNVEIETIINPIYQKYLPEFMRKLYGALTDLTSIMLHSAAKVHYGTSLSNVDWLHGSAELLLTITNLFIVIGLRQAVRKAKDANVSTTSTVLEVKDNKKSSL